jgi:hypothetical protein
MSDAGVAGQRLGFQARFKISELAFGAAAFQMVALQRGDTSGIVAAVFEALKRIHDLIRDRTASENADNAAHAVEYPQIDENVENPGLS